MRRMLMLSILLASCWSVLGEEAYKKGYQLYQQERYQDALVFLEEAIVANPDWYFPVLIKGQCHFKLNQFDKALAHLNDCLTLEPPSKDIPSVKYYIAMSHMLQKDYPQAVQAFDSLLTVAPPNRRFDIYLNRGQSELQIAKAAESSDDRKATSYYKKSYVSFSEALKNSASSQKLKDEAMFQRSYSFYKQEPESIGHLKRSIDAFETVIQNNPKDDRAHRFAISLQLTLVEKSPEPQRPQAYREAVAQIDGFLKNWPNDTDMLRKKGLALQGAKEYDKAVDTLKRVAQLLPNDGQVLFSLGSSQVALKRYDAALGSFRQAKSKGQADNVDLYLLSAFCEVAEKTNCAPMDIPKYERAVNILEEGAGKVPGSAKAAIRKDLDRKRNTLQTLRENLAADNKNHEATLKNIAALQEAIQLNKDRLRKNRELYVQQPTEELQAAIDEGTEAIRADTEKLDAEFEVLKAYIGEARKCGGAQYFPNYQRMTAVVKTQEVN